MPAASIFHEKAGQISNSILSMLPSRLDSVAKARELLQIAGVVPVAKSMWRCPEDDEANVLSNLFTFTFHVMGGAQQLRIGELGKKLQGYPVLANAMRALHGMPLLHGSLIR